MRLIDADALTEEIEKNMDNGFPANENLSLYAISCLAHAPTVCDIEQIRAEIDRLHVVETIYDGVYAVDAADVIRIIDKYIGDKQIYDKSRKDVLKQITDEIKQTVDEETKHDEKWARGLQYSLCIIDKYKTESEERNERII